MKKIFMLCMAGALAMTAASCGDDDEGGGKSGKMTVNGRTEEVKSAIYGESPAGEPGEREIFIYLFKDVITGIPQEQPDFTIAITSAQSLLGKTIDLTQPNVGSSNFSISVVNGNSSFGLICRKGSYIASDSKTPDQTPTINSGTLLMTHSGDDFTIKMSLTLSTGSSASADWKGKATKVELPY